MKVKNLVFNLISIFFFAISLNGDDIEERKSIEIKKGEYIIGDIPLNKLHKKFDLEKNPLKDYFLRNFNLEYDFSINTLAINGDSPLIIGEEQYKEYLENISKDKSPYKYLEEIKKEYKIYATFQDAINYCEKVGERVQRDFELEIALKYYNVPPGFSLKKNSEDNNLNAYYEYAYDKENNPVLIKYFWGKIKNFKGFLIFFDKKIKIKKDEPIAASLRCVKEH